MFLLDVTLKRGPEWVKENAQNFSELSDLFEMAEKIFDLQKQGAINENFSVNDFKKVKESSLVRDMHYEGKSLNLENKVKNRARAAHTGRHRRRRRCKRCRVVEQEGRQPAHLRRRERRHEPLDKGSRRGDAHHQPIHAIRIDQEGKPSLLHQSLETRTCHTPLRAILRFHRRRMRQETGNGGIRRRHESGVAQRRPRHHHHRLKTKRINP